MQLHAGNCGGAEVETKGLRLQKMTREAKVCVLGYFADLPYDRNASINKLMGKIESKEVLYFDLLDRGVGG